VLIAPVPLERLERLELIALAQLAELQAVVAAAGRLMVLRNCLWIRAVAAPYLCCS
jgi:hypothetical protein